MQMNLVAAFLLGNVTTGIGLLHQVFNRTCMRRDGDHTDTHAKLKIPALPFKSEIIDILAHFFSHRLCAFQSTIYQQYAELITTQAPDTVLFTQVICEQPPAKSRWLQVTAKSRSFRLKAITAH